MSLVKVQERVSTVANEINDIQNEIYKKLTDLKLKEEAWESVLNSMQECALAAADRIDFNIGGQLFSTSKKTLLRVKGTFFEGLLSSGKCVSHLSFVIKYNRFGLSYIQMGSEDSDLFIQMGSEDTRCLLS